MSLVCDVGDGSQAGYRGRRCQANAAGEMKERSASWEALGHQVRLGIDAGTVGDPVGMCVPFSFQLGPGLR